MLSYKEKCVLGGFSTKVGYYNIKSDFVTRLFIQTKFKRLLCVHIIYNVNQTSDIKKLVFGYDCAIDFLSWENPPPPF